MRRRGMRSEMPFWCCRGMVKDAMPACRQKNYETGATNRVGGYGDLAAIGFGNLLDDEQA